MKNFARFSGGLGLICLLFGLISLMFSGVFHTVALFQFAIALAGLAFFAFYFTGDVISVVMRRREAIFGALGGVILLGVLIGLNVIAHSKFGGKTFDTTKNRIHTLAAESQEIAQSLDAPVEILAFFPAGSEQEPVLKNLVGKYTPYTDKLSLKMIDPDKNPALVSELGADRGNVMIRNSADKTTIKLAIASEEAMTNALKRVLRSEIKTIYFITGHDEASLDNPGSGAGVGLFKLLLEMDGFKVLPLKLAETKSIPRDASAVLLWGARRALPALDVEILRGYLAKGGSLIIGQNPIITKTGFGATGYEKLLETYGLTLTPSIISENYNLQGLQGSITLQKLATASFGNHPIVSKLAGQASVEFNLAQPVRALANYKGPAKVSSLVETSKNAWAETDLAALVNQKPVRRDGQELQGPLSVAMISEWPVEKAASDDWSKNGRLIVFGDSRFVFDEQINSANNRDLAMNAVGYIIGDRAAALSIKARTWSTSSLNMSSQQKIAAVYASIFILPQALLILSLFIWLRRRSRV
jgi:ABC-type uncharacterized transport system involved in gliding motility auxiliary subunit